MASEADEAERLQVLDEYRKKVSSYVFARSNKEQVRCVVCCAYLGGRRGAYAMQADST